MRRTEGREAWHRLLEWDKGQAPSERLAALLLSNEGFKNVDPSHPLGGRDGLKDMMLSYNGSKWIGAVYFPRGQQSFSDIKDKFSHDLDGVKTNGAVGIAFVTNQELRLSERKILTELDPSIDVQIYHLERIASLLNTPAYYGIRMEFLEIEMSKEEQIAFFANQGKEMTDIKDAIDRLTIGLEEYKIRHQLDLSKKTSNDAENYNEELTDDEYFADEPRSIEEIVNATEEFLDKIWFDRHLSLKYKIEFE